MFGRLLRLMRKELREILRDRRTIITLVIMPLLIYPLLALAFQRFLLTSLSGDQEVEYVVGFESEADASVFAKQLGLGSAELDRREDAVETKRQAARDSTDAASPVRHSDAQAPGGELAHPVFRGVLLPAGTAERHVEDASVHLAVVLRQQAGEAATSGLSSPKRWQLTFRAGSPSSEAALQFVESRLRAYNDSHLDEQLKRLGVVAALPATTERNAVSFAGAPLSRWPR